MSDYVLPANNGKRDHVAVFVVSAGQGVRERSEAAKNAGYYFRSHGLQSLAIEAAEACAGGLGISRPARDVHGTAVYLEVIWARGIASDIQRVQTSRIKLVSGNC